MLHNKYMDICYDYKYKSALAVSYSITKENLYKKKLSRDKVKFHADKRLVSKIELALIHIKRLALIEVI